MNRRVTLKSAILASLFVLGVVAPGHAEVFSPRDTVIGSAGADKDKADKAGRVIAVRAQNTLLAAKVELGFNIQEIHLGIRPGDTSLLGLRISESAQAIADVHGWSYPNAPWVIQGALFRAGDDAILKLRLIRKADGAMLLMHPILLVGMGPRSWMGPISSVKPW